MTLSAKQINFSFVIVIGLLILLILLMAKCKGDRIAKLEQDNFIANNNIEVLNDSIVTHVTKNEELIQEKGVLISSKTELKQLNQKLYNEINILENEVKNAKSQVAVRWRTRIVHDTVYIKPNVVKTEDGSYIVSFEKDTSYNENNSRHIAGFVVVDIIDSNQVSIGEVAITKDEVDMDATLVLGTKDNKLKVWLKTDYPGFEAESIEAVTLDPKIHPELRKLDNKRHSIGPIIGIGIGQNFTITPTIGIGYQYSLFKF